jgi:hypothetical protein
MMVDAVMEKKTIRTTDVKRDKVIEAAYKIRKVLKYITLPLSLIIWLYFSPWAAILFALFLFSLLYMRKVWRGLKKIWREWRKRYSPTSDVSTATKYTINKPIDLMIFFACVFVVVVVECLCFIFFTDKAVAVTIVIVFLFIIIYPFYRIYRESFKE